MNGLPFSSLGHFPNPGIKPASLRSPALVGEFFTASAPSDVPDLGQEFPKPSWSPLRGVKGVKPPMEFGEMTRDCFPGHAGKKALISR